MRLFHQLADALPKSPEPYTREELLEAKFTELLKGISFSEEVLAWVTLALRESQADERKFHDQALVRLQREHRPIQERIDAMSLDKLDGRADREFFDRKAGEWRAEQARIQREIDTHGAANQSYIEEGIKLHGISSIRQRAVRDPAPTGKTEAA